MVTCMRGLALLCVFVLLATTSEAQSPSFGRTLPPSRRQQRPQPPSRNLPRARPVTPPRVRRIACFVRNCALCNSRNSYVCTQCRPGYALTNGVACNSCAPNYQQNLNLQSFQCDQCPTGTTSPGGIGEDSQCIPITISTGRRLFDVDEDLWA